MPKFKVGDLVVRNDVLNHSNTYSVDYSYTNKDAGKMEVVQNDCCNKGMIKVKILSHSEYESEIGREYEVLEKCFDLAKLPIKLTENSTELERWMVLLNE